MFIRLADFSEYHVILNIFKYITFRSSVAFLSSVFIVLAIGPKIIDLLHSFQGEKGQPARVSDLPIHAKKIGIPTMGGIMILVGLIGSSLLWADMSSLHVKVILFLTIGFGLVGFYDDYMKIKTGDKKGLSWKIRIAVELVLATFAVCALLFYSKSSLFNVETTTSITFPFFKDFILDIGIFFIPFAALVIVATANAVNLTDGLDSLAIVLVMIASAAFSIITYVTGNIVFAHYLQISFVPGVGELVVIISALIGAGLGFLWFNAPPASVFMGDTGSLALGALIGGIAVSTKHEVVMIIIGGVFVVEILSVIIQVLYFKMTGRRFFLMAPIHHHFEKKGWAESQIIIRFWIFAIILAVVGLLTLKMR
ncbi:phospho-N-acetylmuramoyl-pentapeptide-transferase [Candidatus Liberibacter solanacearum]|uniref:Phospho-N-acetylmuramoyl-pentapeptide-transferase n=1 Tax=Candidatus Liberibacter solanacearum TaxID=556287 RepID=A0A1V2N972_9HYPH|nr:phospho-N-acetylmuramoyl-pentapeptide-transferase [Candidatus Liberibacter solanacearum]ONI58679.1 phospho-N-acetylmuramoyl-pentapeptide-transferase [Candidatus Liberibacter solanacearum]ONI60287.1 phospho-N-acetylmuramoyl-pentapeptide-transferase [Candidatus Liberibacter solanacearum]